MPNRILHVSGDFPDPIEPFKTPVIKSFLDLTADDFDHCVMSINRKGPRFYELPALLVGRPRKQSFIQSEQAFHSGTALEYCAPGRGIFHRTMLERLAEHLANFMRAQPEPFDLIVGHKLTIEGIAVAKAAELTGIPYALTIQGNTDRRILKARPDLRKLFRSIYLNAKSVTTFTPIARRAIEAMLGKRPDGIHLIPCPTELDTIVEPTVTGGDVISVFHLKNYAVKNLEGLAQAAVRMGEARGTHPIAILGGGSDEELAQCKDITKDADQIHFAGAVERADMQERMNQSSVLVMPSRAESFGLVFVEALFAGLPIIYPKGTAIDGYFEGQIFAQAVDANSPAAIAGAIEQAIEQEPIMKRALAQWQKSETAEAFTRKAITQEYKRALEIALA